MSTLRVDNITDLGDDPVVTNGAVVAIPGRNLLYNGAMQVAQRGTSATGITASGYHTADRWNTILSGLGTWTQTVEADGPTGSGFTKSLKMECTTADGSPAASDQLSVRQYLEGQDLQALKKGTASAESLTLSFWVKSNVTGTYIFSIIDFDNSRLISAPYTVSSSGTWEKKTITLDGDTSGILDNDNATSLQLFWWLGVGSDRSSGTLQTSWGTDVVANRAVGQVNLAASTSNYWQITGVQLEAGTVATTFEHKAYGVELAECQRYYYRLTATATSTRFGVGMINVAGNAFVLSIQHPVPFRVPATSIETSAASAFRYWDTNVSINGTSGPVFDSGQVTELSTSVFLNLVSGSSAYRPGFMLANSVGTYIGMSAEL